MQDCTNRPVKALALRGHQTSTYGERWIYLCEDHDVTYGLKPATIFTILWDNLDKG